MTKNELNLFSTQIHTVLLSQFSQCFLFFNFFSSKINLLNCRLEYSKTLFAAGVERGGSGDLLKVREWQKKNERALADAKKDNDFIYHERVGEI